MTVTLEVTVTSCQLPGDRHFGSDGHLLPIALWHDQALNLIEEDVTMRLPNMQPTIVEPERDGTRDPLVGLDIK